jgi:hypothetical protein
MPEPDTVSRFEQAEQRPATFGRAIHLSPNMPQMVHMV